MDRDNAIYLYIYLHTHTHTYTHKRSCRGDDTIRRSVGRARAVRLPRGGKLSPGGGRNSPTSSLRWSAAWWSVRSSAVDDERRDRLTDDDNDEVKFKLAPSARAVLLLRNPATDAPPQIFAAAHTWSDCEMRFSQNVIFFSVSHRCRYCAFHFILLCLL